MSNVRIARISVLLRWMGLLSGEATLSCSFMTPISLEGNSYREKIAPHREKLEFLLKDFQFIKSLKIWWSVALPCSTKFSMTIYSCRTLTDLGLSKLC